MSAPAEPTTRPAADGGAVAAALSAIEHDLRTVVLPEAGAAVSARLRRTGSGGAATPADITCLFLPGRFGTAAQYTDDDARDIRRFLSARGVDVYTLEPRPTPSTSSGGGEAWGTEAWLGDVARCLALLAPRRVVLIGHSMGAFLAYLAAARWPDRVAGVVALDGGVVAPDRAAEADLRPLATRLLATRPQAARLVAPGGDEEWESFSRSPQRLRHLLGQAADGQAAALRTLGHMLALPAVGRDGCMLSPTSDLDVLGVAAAFVGTLRPTWPRRQTVQARLITLSGPGTWVDETLPRAGAAGVRVFAVVGAAGGDSRVARNVYTARRADPAATVAVVDGYGHLDVLFGPDVRRSVFEPVLSWVTAVGRSA